MKKNTYILLLTAVFALALVSCNKDDSSSRVLLTMTYADSYVVVPYYGGTYSTKYSITNGKDDAYMIASTEEDWISDFDFSVASYVGFSVAEHFEREARYGDVELYYMLGADTLSTITFRVAQEYYSYYSLETSYASGEYYGMANYYNNDNIGQYSIYFSDTQIDEYGTFTEGATYYFVDLWTNADVEGTSFVSLPEGEYSFGLVGENWILSGESQYFVMKDADDDLEEGIYSDQGEFVAGSLTVTRSGDVTTISGTLEDLWGGVHDISYSGTLSLENMGLYSTLEEDFEVGDFSNVACEARYYGDYYQTGTANWLLCIYPEVGTGFVIDICADASYDLDGGVPEGTFTSSFTGGVSGTFLRGVVFNGYISGTWLVSFDEDGVLTPPYAPICGGTVEISSSGSDYTVTIYAYDDREYEITGSWTGVPVLSDYRTSPSSLKAGGQGMFHPLFPALFE